MVCRGVISHHKYMSLTFGAATSDKVLVGHSGLDNLQTLTKIAWVYPTTLSSRRFIAKGQGSHTQSAFDMSNGLGNIRYIRGCATTDSTYAANNGVVTLNAWNFVACTFDINANPNTHIYSGSISTVAAEVTYATQTQGSGAIFDDTANQECIGNTNDSALTAFQGDIAWAAVWNRVLTLAEIQDQQYFPHVTNGCVLFERLNNSTTGTQLDQSGLQNKGTVTGATVSTRAEPTGVMFYDDPLVINNCQSVKVGNGMSVGERIR